MKRTILFLLIFLIATASLPAEQSMQFFGYYESAKATAFNLSVIPSVVTEAPGDAGRERVDCSTFTSRTEAFSWNLTGGKIGGVKLKFISSALKNSADSSLLLPYTLEVSVERPFVTQKGVTRLNGFVNGYFESNGKIDTKYYRDYVTKSGNAQQTTLNGELCFKMKYSSPVPTGIEMRFDLKNSKKTSSTSFAPVSNYVERSGKCYVTVDDYSQLEPGTYSTIITVVLEEV